MNQGGLRWGGGAVTRTPAVTGVSERIHVGPNGVDAHPWESHPHLLAPAQAMSAWSTMADTKTIDIVFMTLMRELMAGPAVSLNGSPTVSPMTAA